MPRLPVLLLSTLLSAPALAGTQWLCGLSEDLTRLVCIADDDPRDAAPRHEDTTAVVNGTRFPLDPRRRFTVELWSPPAEAASVELLARATLCYRSPSCQVSVALPGYLQAQKK
jgi:hypothetical protein